MTVTGLLILTDGNMLGMRRIWPAVGCEADIHEINVVEPTTCI